MPRIAHAIDPRYVDELHIGGGYGDPGVSIDSSGNIQMDGNLTVVGDISLDDITADTIAVGGGYGDADGGLSIDENGNLSTDGNLIVDGTITGFSSIGGGTGSFSSVSVSGTADFAGGYGLGLTGVSVSGNGDIQSNGSGTFDNTLTVSSTSTFAGLITANGGVSGDLIAATTTAKDLNPEIDNTYGLGTTLIRWANIYGNNTDTSTLTVGSTSIFTGLISANGGVLGNVEGDLTGNLVDATSTAKHLNPDTDSTYNLGDNLIRWATVYADNINTTTATVAGAATVGSLDAGSGLIETTGNATIGGTLGVTDTTTLGVVNAGAITGTSLDAGSGLIQTTGNIQGAAITASTGNVTALSGNLLSAGVVTGTLTVSAASGLDDTTFNGGYGSTGTSIDDTNGIRTDLDILSLGDIVAGADGSARGRFFAYGNGTTSGGEFLAYNASGEDTNVENYVLFANGDNIHLGHSGNGGGIAADYNAFLFSYQGDLDMAGDLDAVDGNFSGTLGVTGSLGVNGNITASANLFATVDTGTDTRYLQIGGGRGAGEHGYAYIDLIGSGDNTTYSSRIIRDNSENGHLNIYNKGTGNIRFYAVDAGGIWFHTNNTVAFDVDSSQNVDFRQNVDVGGALDVTGVLGVTSSAQIGTSFTASSNADDFIIARSSGSVGITIASEGGGDCGIYFADTASKTAGQIRYDHTNDQIEFYTGGTQRAYIDDTWLYIFSDLTVQGSTQITDEYVRVPAATSDPTATLAGSLHFNTTNGKLMVYNGTSWETVTSS